MKIRVNPRWAGRAAAWLIRALGCTLRVTVEDRARATDPAFGDRFIWTFWHNRMLVVPLLPARFMPHRYGSALTSLSTDGAIIAEVMRCFGLGSVRGSSSRRGAAALIGLREVIEQGSDVGVTPDGPRGPVYRLGAGVVYLAQQTGAAILPIHIEYSRAVRLKSWDRFMIPLPFSRVRVLFAEPLHVAPEADVEAERERIEKALQPRDP